MPPDDSFFAFCVLPHECLRFYCATWLPHLTTLIVFYRFLTYQWHFDNLKFY